MSTVTNEPGDPTASLARLIVNAAVPRASADGPLRIGFVTSINPTRVQYPGDLAPMAHTPLAVVAVDVNDQVLTCTIGRRVVILGVVNAARAKGVVFSAVGGTFTDTSCNTALGFGEVAFTPRVGRQYRITWQPPFTYTSVAGTAVDMSIRVTTDGSRPLVGSTQLRDLQHEYAAAGFFATTPALSVPYSVASVPANPTRLLGVVQRLAGSGNVTARTDSAAQAQVWTVEDVGSSATVAGQTVTANTGL